MASKVKSAVNARRLFVGNLKWTVSSSELRQYFSKFGFVIGSSIVIDRQNGLSKGYGFISFNNDKAMQSALTYSSHLLAGRELVIKAATSKTIGNKQDVNEQDTQKQVKDVKERTSTQLANSHQGSTQKRHRRPQLS